MDVVDVREVVDLVAVVGAGGGAPRAHDRFDDLSADEVRVLGCLVELETTSSASYPADLSAVRGSCNQSPGRDPVLDLGADEVRTALRGLGGRGLVQVARGTSGPRYRHALRRMLRLDDAELALVGVLLLRGPQSPADLKGRTERQHEFDSLDEVVAVLSGLAARAEPLVFRTGTADGRWSHCLRATEHGDGGPGRYTADEHSLGLLDPYGEATAEFYDLLATAHWGEFGEELLDALAGVDPADGPLVDLGAGTGAGLDAIRGAVPGVSVHAVEPSKAMRTALHARLALDPGLRSMVTVDPRPLADADLPERACALIANAVVGHLTDAERTVLWRYVAEHLPPGAPAVLEMLPPERPDTFPLQRYRALDVGRYTYEGWQEGEPDDVEHMGWTLTYRVLDGDRRVAEYKVRSRWRCLGPADLRAEIEPFGLELSEHDDYVIVRRLA